MMSKCLKQHEKDIDFTIKCFKGTIKDKLLTELTISYVEDIPKKGKNDLIFYLMVYDLYGCTVKTSYVAGS